MKISCIILAGGQSKRMGKDKAFVKLHDKPLIKHVLDEVQKIFDDIIIIVKNNEQKRKMEKICNVKIVQDNQNIYSPIVGIKEGIKHIKNDQFFVVACDMSFIKSEIIEKLISESNNNISVIPKKNTGKYEPLFAIYNKQFFGNCKFNDSLHKVIDNNQNKKLIFIDDQKIFFNINTLKDLKNINSQNNNFIKITTK